MTTAAQTTATVITDTCGTSEWAEANNKCPSKLVTHTTPDFIWYGNDCNVTETGCGSNNIQPCRGNVENKQTTTWKKSVSMVSMEYGKKKDLPCSGSTPGCTQDYCCTIPGSYILSFPAPRQVSGAGGVWSSTAPFGKDPPIYDNGWEMTNVTNNDGSRGGSARKLPTCVLQEDRYK